MISKKVRDAFNNQINAELYSAYLYYSMQAYFEELNLSGFANWMNIQVQEELSHVAKFTNFINERSGRVIPKAIECPPTEWNSPIAAFEATFVHEQSVSESINKLVDIAIAESDHASKIFLDWFVSEQVEEEASVNAVVQKLKLMKDSPHGLFMIDNELAQRVFTPPADTAT